jgi:hypothetical protein
MNTDQIIAYARPFPADEYAGGQARGLTFAHTFVFAAPDHDWNCYGEGKERIGNPPTRELCRVPGNAAWIDKVYGGSRSGTPMGLCNKVDSVCHNLSNRILAMAGTDQDVSDAEGDLFAVLVYGKYGYQLDSFIDQCKAAAAQLNAQQPGCVPQADLDALAARVKQEEEEEEDTLRRQFTATLKDHPCAVSPDEMKKIMAIYDSFHTQREAIYNDECKKGRGGDFQGRFALRLRPVLSASLLSAESALGSDRAAAIFGIGAFQALKYLVA